MSWMAHHELGGSPWAGWLTMGWMAHHELDGSAVCSSKESQEIQADLKQPTWPKGKFRKASSNFPFLLLSLSSKLRAGCTQISWRVPVSLCSPLPGQSHRAQPGEPGPMGLSQTSCEPVCASASAPLFDLVYLALECLLFQKL